MRQSRLNSQARRPLIRLNGIELYRRWRVYVSKTSSRSAMIKSKSTQSTSCSVSSTSAESCKASAESQSSESTMHTYSPVDMPKATLRVCEMPEFSASVATFNRLSFAAYSFSNASELSVEASSTHTISMSFKL